jgi:hypothetical protein
VIGGIWEAQAGIPNGVHFAHSLGKGMRFPFIDERLAGYVHALPMELKLDKRILLAYLNKNLPKTIVDKPKSGFIFDLNGCSTTPSTAGRRRCRKPGSSRRCPHGSDAVVNDLMAKQAADPRNLKWQHRLYALSLFATVVSKRQEVPLTTEGAR